MKIIKAADTGWLEDESESCNLHGNFKINIGGKGWNSLGELERNLNNCFFENLLNTNYVK